MIKRILLGLLLLPFSALTQHTIKGTFSLEDGYTFGILYRIAKQNVMYVDDSQIKNDGTLVLNLKEGLDPGMYRLVYNLPQDQNFFDFIYNGKEDIEFEFSNEIGVTYLVSEENKILSEFNSGSFDFDTTIKSFLSEETIQKDSLASILRKQKVWYETMLKTSEGLLSHEFIKSWQPFLTEEFISKEDYLEHSKASYFTNFDFNNPLIQNSGFPLEHSLKYIFGFSQPNNPITTYKTNMDRVAEVIAASDLVFQKVLLQQLWYFLTVNEKVELANHLALQHLLPISKKLGDTQLEKELILYTSLSLGAKAPNFSWSEDREGRTNHNNLHAIEGSENYIIVFWSSHCSHCLAEVPRLHELVKNFSPGSYKVIAVGLENEPYDWRNKVFDFPEFINVLGLGKWENEIGNMYDVSGTPTYFVLDKDKKIIAKPKDYEALVQFISN